jgi:DNA-binding Lrp family transcriptional regulator
VSVRGRPPGRATEHPPRNAHGRKEPEDNTVVVQAYILVQTTVGRSSEVATAIRKISGVTVAEDVTGPYDVVVRAEAPSMDELGTLVIKRVQNVPGITRTVTCPVVHV